MSFGLTYPAIRSTPKPEQIRYNALFHYTDARGLMGILDADSIWGTAFYCTNDRSEFMYSTRIIEKLLKDVLFEKFPSQSTSKIASLASKLNSIFVKFAEKKIDGFNAYISCFTTAKDDDSYQDGLLSQWISYGGDGGYAIELNARRFLAEYVIWLDSYADQFHEENIVRSVPLFNRVFYSYEVNTWVDILKFTLIEPLLDRFGDFENISYEKINDALPSGEKKGNFPISLFPFAAYTKNLHFSEENEWRLITLSNEKCNYFNRAGLIVPYVIPPISINSCIERIIIGPSPRIEDRERSVRSLLKHHDLSDVEVKVSEIPYDRG